jgi:hypothetical protein
MDPTLVSQEKKGVESNDCKASKKEEAQPEKCNFEKIATELFNKGYYPIPLGSYKEDPPNWFKNKPENKKLSIEEVKDKWPKSPRIRWGGGSHIPATKDQIIAWAKNWPEANVGIVTNNLFIVDADSGEAIVWSRNNLLYTPLRCSTKKGGHWYYKRDPDWVIGNDGRWKDPFDCDIRANGGYIVAGGSVHPSGINYQFQFGEGLSSIPHRDKLPVFTECLFKEIMTTISTPPKLESGTDIKLDTSLEKGFDFEKTVPIGNRHNYVTSFAGNCYAKNYSIIKAEDMLTKWGESQNPIANLDKHISTLKNIYRKNEEQDSKKAIKFVEELNKKHAIVSVKGKTAILNETYDPTWNRDEISLSSANDLRLLYCNRCVNIQKKGKQTLKSAADIWLCSPDRRQYEGIYFDPSGKEIENYYNLYKGWDVEPQKGDCSLYYDHIKENIANGDKKIEKYTLDWMADAVQNIAKKPGVSIVLRGGQGCGKGVFIINFGSLFGCHYHHVSDSRHVVGHFNSLLSDNLILFADEAFYAGDKQHESALKTLISEDKRIIEFKGKNAFALPNYTRLMMASNKDWVVPVDMDDRRFFIIDVGENHVKDYPYFEAIHKQMNEQGGRAALLFDLLTRDISKVNIKDFPVTKAILDNKMMSLDSVGQWILDKLKEKGFEKKETIKHLFKDYANYCKQNTKLESEYQNFWARKLKKYFPKLVRKQYPTGERYYRFQSLKTCRKNFEKKLGCKLNWNE